MSRWVMGYVVPTVMLLLVGLMIVLQSWRLAAILGLAFGATLVSVFLQEKPPYPFFGDKRPRWLERILAGPPELHRLIFTAALFTGLVVFALIDGITVGVLIGIGASILVLALAARSIVRNNRRR